MSDKYKLFLEITNHILQDASPSIYLNELRDNETFQKYPFEMLYKLQKIEQSPKYHPEGNVWNHTLLVVDEAAKLKNKSKNIKAFMWAALLHDIGKANKTKNKGGKITAYNHDKEGSILAKQFLEDLITDQEFITLVVSLIRWHMQILFVVNNLPYANIKEMSKQVDINEVALLGLCDRIGRLNVDIEKEKKDINIFLKNVRNQSKIYGNV